MLVKIVFLIVFRNFGLFKVNLVRKEDVLLRLGRESFFVYFRVGSFWNLLGSVGWELVICVCRYWCRLFGR